MSIVLEEADETHFWLELVIKGEFMDAKLVKPLLAESNELVAIFTAALKTAKSKKH